MMENSQTNKEVALDVNDIETHFKVDGKSIKALGKVSFKLYKGEMLGIVGESGSGKSALAKSILGILPANGEVVSGTAMFEGEDLITLDKKKMLDVRGKKISMIYQEPLVALNPSFTVGWQIAEVFRLHENASKKEAYQKALEMLKKVRIPDAEKRLKGYPFEFSGGMQQRVLIAIALAFRPEILIADEPTTALDVTVQAEIMDLLQELQDDMNVSILFISHDLNLVMERCSRVMVMYSGEVMEIASSKRLADNPLHPYTIGLMNATPDVDNPDEELVTIPGEISSYPTEKPCCPFFDRCSKAFDKCSTVKPELKELEKDHYVRCHLYE